MDYAPILGSNFVAHLTDKKRYPLLVIGTNSYSYQDVCDLGVIQPRACRILSGIAKELGVKSVRELYRETTPYSLAGTHGCGVTTLYVLLRVFGAVGLDVDKWYVRGEQGAVRTFLTLKDRELKAEARTKEDERKRRRLRSRRQVTASEQHAVHDHTPRKRNGETICD